MFERGPPGLRYLRHFRDVVPFRDQANLKLTISSSNTLAFQFRYHRLHLCPVVPLRYPALRKSNSQCKRIIWNTLRLLLNHFWDHVFSTRPRMRATNSSEVSVPQAPPSCQGATRCSTRFSKISIVVVVGSAPITRSVHHNPLTLLCKIPWLGVPSPVRDWSKFATRYPQ